MSITSTRRSIRTSALAAVAAIGLLGLVACSSGEPTSEEKPTTSASAEAEATEEAPASGATKCTAEQVTTLSSMSGVAVPAEALAASKAAFEPAAVIGDLPTTCMLTFEGPAGTGAYAVMPGGAATLTAVSANATAAGAQVTEAGGTFTGTMDGLTIVGIKFTDLTKETAGFENVDDLVVVVSTGLLG